jgi:hypothetical protein
MHPDSDCDGLDMVGKITRLSNQPNWFHPKMPPESTGIVKTSQRSDSVLVLRHRLLGSWAVYRVGTVSPSSVCETPSRNQYNFGCVSFLFFLVFLIALVGISIRGEVIRVSRVITNRAVV